MMDIRREEDIILSCGNIQEIDGLIRIDFPNRKWVSVESLTPILRNFYAKIYGSNIPNETFKEFVKLLKELEGE